MTFHNFPVFCIVVNPGAQATKLIWFNFAIFAFSGMNIQEYLENFSFRCHFAEVWGKLPFL